MQHAPPVEEFNYLTGILEARKAKFQKAIRDLRTLEETTNAAKLRLSSYSTKESEVPSPPSPSPFSPPNIRKGSLFELSMFDMAEQPEPEYNQALRDKLKKEGRI